MEQPYHWYAVYTKSRSEKKLADRLTEKGIEAYVPLRKTLRQWSDRKKWVREPLISSYVFVNITASDYYEVLNTPGAVKYIWFSGHPAVIPSRQIETLKMLTGSDVEIESISGNIPPGTHVKVVFGPLRGLEGELVTHAGKNRVIVRIDHIDKVLMVTIGQQMLEKVSIGGNL
ncbi:MAG TPA: UpxY family transcription antiterminator [Bacteroidales bacterium]|nr:UpxY family transcription antiterminator [Bacteroidales bacterium]